MWPLASVPVSEAPEGQAERSVLRTASGQRKGRAERKRLKDQQNTAQNGQIIGNLRALCEPACWKCLTLSMCLALAVGLAVFFVGKDNHATKNTYHPELLQDHGTLDQYKTWLVEVQSMMRYDREQFEHTIEDYKIALNNATAVFHSRMRVTQGELEQCKSTIDTYNTSLFDLQTRAEAMLNKQSQELEHCKTTLDNYNTSLLDLQTAMQAKQEELEKCKGTLDEYKTSVFDSLFSLQGKVEAMLVNVTGTVHAKMQAQQQELDQCKGTLDEYTVSVLDLEHKLDIAHELDIKLSARVSDLKASLDRYKSRVRGYTSELASRADQADSEIKTLRSMLKDDWKTLFHGLHWMWRFEATSKEKDELLKKVTALQAEVKKLQASPAKEVFLTAPKPFVCEIDGGKKVQVHIHSMLEGDSGNKPGFHKLREAVARRGVIRAVVGGGDGTVMWADAEAQKHGINTPTQVIWGIVPLGTGNDFSRVAGWGGNNPEGVDENDFELLRSLVRQWCAAKVRHHDVWEVTIKLDHSDGKLFKIGNGKVEEDMKLFSKTFKMVNYFSIGQESQVGMHFDKHRTKSQTCNLFVYGAAGLVQEMRCWGVQHIGNIVANLYNGTSKDGTLIMDSEGDAGEPQLIGNPESLMFLNIQSYAGGKAHLWQLECGAGVDPAPEGQNVDSEQDPGDGRLEVVTLPWLPEG
ncbi:unnamed protein product [Effrenium voratum]|nr:unnamed protein product [Effrenium voratum]